MKERIIEIEADSFEEAARQLYQDDLIVSEESVLVLCYGNLETIEGTAGSTEEALLKAMKLVPQNAEVQAQKNEATPFIIVRKVSGNSEADARDKIELQKAQLLESITLHRRARKGFLGFLSVRMFIRSQSSSKPSSAYDFAKRPDFKPVFGTTWHRIYCRLSLKFARQQSLGKMRSNFLIPRMILKSEQYFFS